MALGSRDDVRLCRECVDWLAGQLGVVSTPIQPVADLSQAVAFYEHAGFDVRIYHDEDTDTDDGYAFVEYDGRSVFDLTVAPIDPTSNGAGCYLIVTDADAWHSRMAAAGLPVTRITDEPWGMREFTLTDPSANKIRIGRPTS